MQEVQQLYVISDLHMGGIAPHQIFPNGELFKQLIVNLLETKKSRSICLVINGDMVDFLAEPDAVCFDNSNSPRKLERIMGDAAFKMVFDSLRNFLSCEKCWLAINLGNHDLEIALPELRQKLIDRLCSKTEDRSRLIICTDGTGIRLQVGSAKVLCLHGNEADVANVCDYEQLRRTVRDLQIGKLPVAWIPNAGTTLVVNVINELKKQFPFVDILKPEFQAVLPVIVALSPASRQQVTECLRVFRRFAADWIRTQFSWLGAPLDQSMLADNYSDTSVDEVALEQMLARTFNERAGRSQRDYSKDMLAEIEQRYLKGDDPLTSVYHSDWLAEKATSTSRSQQQTQEQLRMALLVLADEEAWQLDYAKDKYYSWIETNVGPENDFVILGHTHIRRAIKRGPGAYFNSGTWARVLPLTKKILSTRKFDSLFNSLKSGSLSDLDNWAQKTGIAVSMPTVVKISVEQQAVVGQLLDVSSHTGKAQLKTVPRSVFKRSSN